MRTLQAAKRSNSAQHGRGEAQTEAPMVASAPLRGTPGPVPRLLPRRCQCRLASI